MVEYCGYGNIIVVLCVGILYEQCILVMLVLCVCQCCIVYLDDDIGFIELGQCGLCVCLFFWCVVMEVMVLVCVECVFDLWIVCLDQCIEQVMLVVWMSCDMVLCNVLFVMQFIGE